MDNTECSICVEPDRAEGASQIMIMIHETTPDEEGRWEKEDDILLRESTK